MSKQRSSNVKLIYINISDIRNRIGPVDNALLREAIIHAGEELDLVYMTRPTLPASKDISYLSSLIISDLRKMLTRIVHADILEINELKILHRGMVYVTR